MAPYFQSLSKNLNPNNFDWDKLDNYYIENTKISNENVDYLMNLFWIKSLFVIDDNFPKCENFRQLTSFNTNSTDGYKERVMYICDYKPTRYSNFIEVIDPNTYKVVDKSWNLKVSECWKKNKIKECNFIDRQFKEDIENIYTQEAYNSMIKYEFSQDFQSLKIWIDKSYDNSLVSETVPILIKQSFFPNWKAYGKDGKKVALYRTFPNLTISFLKDEITLKYEISTCEKISYLISFVSWIFVILIVVLMKIFPIKRFFNLKKLKKILNFFKT